MDDPMIAENWIHIIKTLKQNLEKKNQHKGSSTLKYFLGLEFLKTHDNIDILGNIL